MAVKLAVPPIVEAAKSIAAFSVIATFAPVIANAPKVDDAWSKVMSALPLFKVVAPAIVKVPLSVIAPPAVADKLAAVNALRSKAVVSTIVTALPESVAKVTVPPKLLPALFKVIAASVPAVFVKVDAPVIANAPLLVIASDEVIAKVPPTVDAPRSVAAFSVIATFAPVIANAPKLDASVKVMSALPLFKVVAPVIAKTPLSVIA